MNCVSVKFLRWPDGRIFVEEWLVGHGPPRGCAHFDASPAQRDAIKCRLCHGLVSNSIVRLFVTFLKVRQINLDQRHTDYAAARGIHRFTGGRTAESVEHERDGTRLPTKAEDQRWRGMDQCVSCTTCTITNRQVGGNHPTRNAPCPAFFLRKSRPEFATTLRACGFAILLLLARQRLSSFEMEVKLSACYCSNGSSTLDVSFGFYPMVRRRTVTQVNLKVVLLRTRSASSRFP